MEQGKGSVENVNVVCIRSTAFSNPAYSVAAGIFRSNYTNHPEIVSVEQSDEIITEQSGYMSTKEMVERLVLAGQRLYDYRHGILDLERQTGAEDDDDVEDQMESSPYDEDPVDQAIRIDSEMAYQSSKKASQRAEKPSEAASKDALDVQQEKASSGPSEGPPDA